MTSNLGSEYLLDGIEPDGTVSAFAKEKIDKLLKQSFRPEFLNRLDEIITFKPLTMNDMMGIVDLILTRLADRLRDKQLHLNVTDKAKTAVINLSYNPQYGARPIKRFIQANIETMLARTILSGQVSAGNMLLVDYNQEKGFFVEIK